MKPLLTDEEYAITVQVANNFGAGGGVGEKLQLMLEDKGKKSSNWVKFFIFEFQIPNFKYLYIFVLAQ